MMLEPDITEHRLWLLPDMVDELRGGARVHLPYRESLRRPEVGDIVLVRSSGQVRTSGGGDDEDLRVMIVSVDQDAEVTTTLERLDWRMLGVVHELHWAGAIRARVAETNSGWVVAYPFAPDTTVRDTLAEAKILAESDVAGGLTG